MPNDVALISVSSLLEEVYLRQYRESDEPPLLDMLSIDLTTQVLKSAWIGEDNSIHSSLNWDIKLDSNGLEAYLLSNGFVYRDKKLEVKGTSQLILFNFEKE